MGIHLGEHRGDSHQTCSHLWEDNNWVMCGTKKNSCKHMMTHVIVEAETWAPGAEASKLAVGQEHMLRRRRRTRRWKHKEDGTKFPLKMKLQDFGTHSQSDWQIARKFGRTYANKNPQRMVERCADLQEQRRPLEKKLGGKRPQRLIFGCDSWSVESAGFGSNKEWEISMVRSLVSLQKKRKTRRGSVIEQEQQDWRGLNSKRTKILVLVGSPCRKPVENFGMGLRNESGARIHAAHLCLEEYVLVEEYERSEHDGGSKQSNQMGAHLELAPSWTCLGQIGVSMGQGRGLDREGKKAYEQNGQEGCCDLRPAARENSESYTEQQVENVSRQTRNEENHGRSVHLTKQSR